MTPALWLVCLAIGGFAAALSWMAVLLWRVACAWFATALDGAAASMR